MGQMTTDLLEQNIRKKRKRVAFCIPSSHSALFYSIILTTLHIMAYLYFIEQIFTEASLMLGSVLSLSIKQDNKTKCLPS